MGTKPIVDQERAETIIAMAVEIKKYKNIIERIVDYFRSDKALFPNGTLDSILDDAKQALKGK